MTYTEIRESMEKEMIVTLPDYDWQLIATKIAQALAEERERVRGEIKEAMTLGKHHFEVGYNFCKMCGEKRIIIDRKILGIIVDEKSSGRIIEAEQTVYDQTEDYCPKNQSYELNSVLKKLLSSLQDINPKE